MNLDGNFFELFDIPVSWQVSLKDIKNKQRSLQQQFHPDLFVNCSNNEKRLAVERAAKINEAYRALSSPLSRAKHLLSIYGHDTNNENFVSSDTAFLIEQIEYREALDGLSNSRDPDHELERLRGKVELAYQELQKQFGDFFSANHTNDALKTFSKMQFFSKLLDQVCLTEQKLEDQ